MKRIYVEFALEYGRMLPEVSTERVERADPGSVSPPSHCYGFRFFEQTAVEQDGETLVGEARDIGPYYFVGGRVETLAEVDARNDPAEKILRDNMRCNGYAVIRTRCGRVLPFDPDRHVIVEAPAP